MSLKRLTKAELVARLEDAQRRLEAAERAEGGRITQAVAEFVARQHPEVVPAQASALAEIAYRLAGLLEGAELDVRSAAGIAKELRATLEGLVVDAGDDDGSGDFLDELSSPSLGDAKD